MERHVVVAGELDRAERQHPPARGGDLEHLVERDPWQPARARHDPGVGREHPRDVGVDLAAVGAQAAASATAVVSEPPRPSVVTSRALETPWKPATTGTMPSASASRRRSPRTSRIRALVCVVSVMMPAWLPVNDGAGTPSSASAMHSSAIEMRSPAVSSMSSSRPGRTRLTSSASRMRSSVVLPIALDDDDHLVAGAPVRATWSATARIRSASPTEVPPNFWTTSAHAGQATASQAPPRADGRPPPRFQ